MSVIKDDGPDRIEPPDFGPIEREYYSLLREAFLASEAEDHFDLDSKDPQSVARWNEIVTNGSYHQGRFIQFIADNFTTLSFQLGVSLAKKRIDQRRG